MSGWSLSDGRFSAVSVEARAPNPVEEGMRLGGKGEALSCGVLVFCIILRQIITHYVHKND